MENYKGTASLGTNMITHCGIVNTAALATSIRNSGNYFYLPAAGYYDGSLGSPETAGYYWASSTCSGSDAYRLRFGSGLVDLNRGNRSYGWLRWKVQ